MQEILISNEDAITTLRTLNERRTIAKDNSFVLFKVTLTRFLRHEAILSTATPSGCLL